MALSQNLLTGLGSIGGTVLGGPLGGMVGSTAGSLLSQLLSALGPTDTQFKEFQRFTPQQQSALSQLLSMGLGGLQDPTAGFAPIEERARMQFQDRTIPSLAERFTAMGGQRSSAFQQALGQAGAGLESQLAAQRAQFGQQNIGQLLQLLQLGLQPQIDRAMIPGGPGVLGSLAQGIGSAIPAAVTSSFGG